MFVTMILADTQIHARMTPDNKWDCVFADGQTGKQWTASLTPQQFEAVAILAIAGEEEIVKPIQERLYEIAEPALEGCGSECRPIP